jgi:glycosyltransferase involved in cell wall biosynthesis
MWVHRGLWPNSERLRQLVRSCDLLALPTRADCFSMAGLEAMASGLPVVTCPVGGVGEVFTYGTEGYYVLPENPSSLASGLEILVSDPFHRRLMGAAVRQLACGRYDARRNSRSLLDLIERVAYLQTSSGKVVAHSGRRLS